MNELGLQPGDDDEGIRKLGINREQLKSFKPRRRLVNFMMIVASTSELPLLHVLPN